MIFTHSTSSDLINSIYRDGIYKDSDLIEELGCRENDLVILNDGGSSSAMMIIKNGLFVRLEKQGFCRGKIKGRNKEQEALIAYLKDEDIKCVIITGAAGSGKTYLTMGFAYSELTGDGSGNYQECVLSRPPVAPSKKFASGFLPGSLDEKMKPWMAIFYDKLNEIRQLLTSKAEIAIREQSLEYIKGKSFNYNIVVVDEAEDLTVQELIAIMTRIGKNSKLILLGDINQATERGCKDSLHKVIDKFRSTKLSPYEQRMIAHIDLVKTERSPFVELVLKVFK